MVKMRVAIITLSISAIFVITNCTNTNIPTPAAPIATFTALPTATPPPETFSGERALADAAAQLAFGPRTAGSLAHKQAGGAIALALAQAGWEVEIQETRYQRSAAGDDPSGAIDQPVRNIIGKWGQGKPWLVLGAHYDSRLLADKDPDPANQTQPVPGANDGASGVGVLLELARTLPGQIQAAPPPTTGGRAQQIWLVFFDAEDNGHIPGWDWILGSRAFVESLERLPQAAVIIDMIGDRDLNLRYEQSSNPLISQEIWSQAASLGYSVQFIPEAGYNILDDHWPFLEAGIPAADLIDFDYPYYHTSADTLDKLSAESLAAIGETLTAWILDGSQIFGQP